MPYVQQQAELITASELYENQSFQFSHYIFPVIMFCYFNHLLCNHATCDILVNRHYQKAPTQMPHVQQHAEATTVNSWLVIPPVPIFTP